MPTDQIRMRVKDVGPLLDFALLQPLELLPSEQHRSERARKIIRRSAKFCNASASLREGGKATEGSPRIHPRSSLLRQSSDFGYEGRKLQGIRRRRIKRKAHM